jgi:hypothetical protein
LAAILAWLQNCQELQKLLQNNRCAQGFSKSAIDVQHVLAQRRLSKATSQVPTNTQVLSSFGLE